MIDSRIFWIESKLKPLFRSNIKRFESVRRIAFFIATIKQKKSIWYSRIEMLKIDFDRLSKIRSETQKKIKMKFKAPKNRIKLLFCLSIVLKDWSKKLSLIALRWANLLARSFSIQNFSTKTNRIDKKRGQKYCKRFERSNKIQLFMRIQIRYSSGTFKWSSIMIVFNWS